MHFLYLYLHTTALNADPDLCFPKVKPHPMKTIYTVSVPQVIKRWAQTWEQCYLASYNVFTMGAGREGLKSYLGLFSARKNRLGKRPDTLGG